MQHNPKQEVSGMTVQEFRSLLSLAEKGVTRRSTQPVQNNVLVERDADDRIRLSATDLEFVDVSTWQEGFNEHAVVYRITLPPKVLKGALKGRTPGTEVTFRPVTTTEVDLHLNGSVSRLRGMAAEDFEAMPSVEKEFAVEFSRDDLATLEHVARACSTDETRPTLTGMLIRFGAGMNKPEVVATDTCRLTKATLRTEALGPAEPADYILVRRALGAVFAAAQKEGVVTGAFGEKVSEFRGERWRVRTRPVEGQFPDYTRVIPDTAAHSAGLRVEDAREFRSALGDVASVASEDGNRVAFAPSTHGVTLFAESVEVGKAQAELPAVPTGNGKSWPIGLNAQYLIDALPERGPVTVTWDSVLEPVVVTAPGAPLTVLMPMVLDDTLKANVAAVVRGGAQPAPAPQPTPEPAPKAEPAPPAEVGKPEPGRWDLEARLQKAEADARKWGKPVRVTVGAETLTVTPEGQRIRMACAWPLPTQHPVTETAPEVQPEPAPCEVCEGKGELYTVTGAVRPCPLCVSTVPSSPEPADVPAAPAEVVTAPEEVRAVEPEPTPAPSAPVPHLSFVDKETRKQEVKRALEDFCDTIAAGVGDATFDAFLSYAARFHRYSWRNTLLIMFQRPDATFVAGYQRWRDLGRSVKRGSKAIWILAPSRYQKTVETGDGDTEEVEALFFRPVPVFADVDTEGDGPVPTFRPDLAEAGSLLPTLHKVAASWGVPVLRQACEGNGWSDGQRVNVDPALPAGVAAQRLIHELAHLLLRHRDLGEKHEGDRRLFESEAEAVKVVVLRHFGVDTSSNGAAYLRAHGASADVVKRSAHRIMDTAKQVVEALEGALAELEAQPVAAG
jgi:DNA polymerase III sliding clamp (beta) subunit (PCNA family)